MVSPGAISEFFRRSSGVGEDTLLGGEDEGMGGNGRDKAVGRCWSVNVGQHRGVGVRWVGMWVQSGCIEGGVPLAECHCFNVPTVCV